ncbi:MAG: transposase [Variovorax sp.]|nr:MAG: transposase [Variovorax sp.]
MTYFTGIDVPLRSVSICIVDEHGEVCHEAKTAAQPAAIAQCLNSFSADVKSVGLEAGTLTQFLAHGLQAAGFEVICMEARQGKNTLAAMRNKTDRNDARNRADPAHRLVQPCARYSSVSNLADDLGNYAAALCSMADETRRSHSGPQHA